MLPRHLEEALLAQAAARRGAAGAGDAEPEFWEDRPLDHPRLLQRAAFYAGRAGVGADTQGALLEVLGSPLGRALCALRRPQLHAVLVNDAYKPKMHRLYSALWRGVTADFALSVRRTPFPLARLRAEDPQLFRALQRDAAALQGVAPITADTEAVLAALFDTAVPQVMRERGEAQGVAPVQWLAAGEDGTYAPLTDDASQPVGDIRATSHGPVEAASHVETSLTQLVQEYTVRAQVQALEREHGVRLDRTERVANALGHLAAVVERLQTLGPQTGQTALFAGRRASDRTYLLLQTLFCARCLPGYAGTSSVFATTLLWRCLREAGAADPALLRPLAGRLIGTHAHELPSMAAQLLAATDNAAGPLCGSEAAPLTALLAHLLLFRANGGLQGATALADTFGTRAFVALALAAELPPEFLQDMAQDYPQGPQHEAGARVFDLFRVWRIDSGDYAEIAECVVAAWEARCRALGPAKALPKPSLMDSNLGHVEEVLAAFRLPERIRPAVCAFGGLADGFLPFETASAPRGPPQERHTQAPEEVEVSLASVVMKVVQARGPGGDCSRPPLGGAPGTQTAGKLGDDAQLTKAQVDFRLSPGAQEAARARMVAMLGVRHVSDPAALSRLLAQAYHAVTREGALC